MKPGSVAVDLAVERGGNVEGAVADQVVEVEGVKVVGYTNMPAASPRPPRRSMPRTCDLLETMVDKETKTLALNLEDELVKATMLTHGGAVVHPNFAAAPATASATA
jgi:NAD(P) transhydrogenase subunit alpha